MNAMFASRTQKIFLAAMLAVFFLGVAGVAYAQSSETELHTTIRQAVLSDPRSSGMSEAELDAMVNALTAEAESQGMTAQDITWRPQTMEGESEEVVTSSCSFPAFMCALNQAFGFDESSLWIPTGLGITSAFLLFVVGMMIEHHRQKLALARPRV